MVNIFDACPECGCRDLRLANIDRDGHIYIGRIDHVYCFPRDAGKKMDYCEVAQCFKCGWRQETPWEIGKRMARESAKKLNLNLNVG